MWSPFALKIFFCAPLYMFVNSSCFLRVFVWVFFFHDGGKTSRRATMEEVMKLMLNQKSWRTQRDLYDQDVWEHCLAVRPARFLNPD